MSGRLVGEVLTHAPIDLTMLQRFVLVSLAETAQDKDRTARYHSSCDAISTRIQSTPGSVRNALQTLRERGLIVPQIEKARRGKAQQWFIPKMTEATRRATWDAPTDTSAPTRPAAAATAARQPTRRSSGSTERPDKGNHHTEPTTDTSGGDAAATTADEHTETPDDETAKRHPPVTLRVAR